ncbi:3',5'-cyclic-AMP phosphodiesterase [Marinobacter nanhaiticus D15-8W]|uniref:3',5'-cyclic-AMP phosphodiesterase n=1 Tax=Marinobacter nanhaiticus D15-8W TaxID=626887 RepID=N6WM68_9GAMM|nr:3',5'-cyclic-AMP phosphodiesterase [Marinobacter nanhaiticus]ENO12586.1 3',5'-cyclic-AMP phosphodiesterase [Marinobacter nanhaiticus D15-8W]BES69924.1 3',5'-cyclic-AMP phosphodiesterase [Marinobacter nanhaiticus D15-8W]
MPSPVSPENIATRAPSLRILQLTDPHLMADPEGTLLGMNTRESLDAVIALAKREPHAPDLVIASGDIAQDSSETAYRVFQEKMSVYSCPVIWFPGNHDDVEVMHEVIAGTNAEQRRLLVGGWQLIFLNSAVPGKVYGALSSGELSFLNDCLAEHPERPTLIAFHHHPVDVNCTWMSQIGLTNSDALMAVLEGQSQVRALLWGHIHQTWDGELNGMRLMATPSTCIQFAPGSNEFSIDGQAPGYRWIDLYPDGTLDTHVRRAEDYVFTVDLDSQGY